MFGAGYPSLPTMTQEEYFEKELREGKIVAEFRYFLYMHCMHVHACIIGLKTNTCYVVTVFQCLTDQLLKALTNN